MTFAKDSNILNFGTHYHRMTKWRNVKFIMQLLQYNKPTQCLWNKQNDTETNWWAFLSRWCTHRSWYLYAVCNTWTLRHSRSKTSCWMIPTNSSNLGLHFIYLMPAVAFCNYRLSDIVATRTHLMLLPKWLCIQHTYCRYPVSGRHSCHKGTLDVLS